MSTSPVPGFNLVTEPFIPCLDMGARQVELGLRDALAQSHVIRELRDDSPLVTVALHRLLLAIVHAASAALKTSADWNRIWRAGRFDAGSIDQYLAKWESRFDIFDPEYPFYQACGWELPREKRKGVNELAQELTRGNNATLFDHTCDDPPLRLEFAEVARQLIANQSFAAAGGVSATGNRTGAPLVGQVVVMPTGATLWETLMFNLLPAGIRRGVLSPTGIPVWERDESSFTDSTQPQSYLDLLTWQPRRIRLHPVGDAVQEISYAQGRKLEMPEGCFEPMTAYREERPIEFDAGRAVWRDSESLFTTHRQGRERKGAPRNRRPLVLDRLARLQHDGVLEEDRRIGLICAGLKNRQAKVFFWRHDHLPLPLAYVSDEDLIARLKEAVAGAEEVSQRLKNAVKSAVTALLDPTSGRPDPTRRRQMIEAFDAPSLYWSRLETPFRRFFEELAGIPRSESGLRQQRLVNWIVADCGKTAHRAYEDTVGRLDQSARSLRAVQAGYRTLRMGLNQFFNQKNYREEQHGENRPTKI